MINMVREYRKERNITQEELASLAGISRKYLSMIKRNKTTPSIDVAVRLSEELSVNVVRFWGKDIVKNVNECVRVIEEMIFDGCIDDFP